MADLFKVIDERSSIRGYKDEALKPEEIKVLVEAGLKAPTARNEQELHFSVVNGNAEVLKEIQKDLNPDAQNNFYYGAPTVIIISGSDDFGWSVVDAGIAVQNIHLAAKGLGLGSVILGCIKGVMTGEKKAYYNEKLDIPEGYSYQIAVAAGYPTVEKAQHEFNAAKDVSYID